MHFRNECPLFTATKYNSYYKETCKLWCEDPLAVKWEVKKQDYYVNTTEEIGRKPAVT